MHVLIIGAGTTGLLIAQGLKQACLTFSIFESEPSASHYRPREWSMGIHWSLPQLKALLPPDLRVRLKEAQNDLFLTPNEDDVLPIYNGLDGTVLKAVPSPNIIRVSRRKRRAFCSQDIDIEYGYDLANIRYEEARVTAIFTNGEKVAGSTIIGCDGSRSRVREELLGPKAEVSALETAHSNVAVSFGDAEKAKSAVPWDTHDGSVTLAGDAAHPMTPHRGQGLNHAICDASHFVESMKKVVAGGHWNDTITAYSEEVVKGGAEKVLISKQNALVMLNWDQLIHLP